MNRERDKYLTEVMGECWHEKWGKESYWLNGELYYKYICMMCGFEHKHVKPDRKHFPEVWNNFSTWEGFGKLWEWTIKQEWWGRFLRFVMFKDGNPILAELKFHLTNLINPDRFADAVYEFLKKEAKERKEFIK